MIDKERKLLFLHIPKTAGKTIQTYFFGSSTPAPHLKSMDYLNKIHTQMPDYFVFSFVRNPWDRLVSLFVYIQNKPGPKNASENLFQTEARKLTLPQLIDNLSNIKDFFSQRKSDIHLMTIPQCKYLYDNSGRSVTKFVGRFETLQTDVYTVCDMINFPKKELLHLNKTIHKSYREYYTDEMRKKVANFYQEDIDKFKYTF